MGSRRRRIAILGSTGSIGRSALSVAEAHPDAFEVVGLSAHRNVELLASQARRFDATRVVVGDDRADRTVFPPGVEVSSGVEALESLASDPSLDLVVNAIVGAAGLRPTAASAGAGKRLALANKESLVAAGEIVTRLARRNGAEIIPIDSEHSSVMRCLKGVEPAGVASVVLTASGGPLRDLPLSAVADADLSQVLSHPTWDMGTKVTVDSATLVNKAMEVIEARWLFDLPPDRIDVLVHPQGVVHCMVELVDGTVLSHMGAPDMRLPIKYALSYPARVTGCTSRLDLAGVGTLEFLEPDFDAFPALGLGYRVAETGGTSGAVLSAANEEAVGAFLDGRIGFLDIVEVVEEVLDAHHVQEAPELADVLAADRWAREETRHCLAQS